LHRFRITELNEGAFQLRGQERDHLVRVLRLRPGQELLGFDNSGREWLARVEKIDEDCVTCSILAVREPQVEARLQAYLVIGLTKGEKMEWVIQKGTELGMAGLLPLRAGRSVLRLEGKKAAERTERWRKIAVEAAKQSRRVIEPTIAPVSHWQEIKRLLPEETQCLIAYEGETSRRLLAVMEELDPVKPVAVIIGPEGGFEEAEVAWAEQSLKALPVSLGSRILRAETAALAALTLVLGYGGDLG
jgi:16S rRNA (uracil1498-N3)-methyltransferase